MIQLPSDFITQMTALLGVEEFHSLEEALQTDRITSIRLNSKKNPTNPTLNTNATLVPWCTSGRYLTERPLFTMDPLFHAGVYYAQEASSMFVEQAIKQNMNKLNTTAPLVLDLCAAPGGKSTHLANLIGDNGWLVTNEVMKSRIGILNENITKWGAPNVTVTNNDPKDFAQLTGLFDILLIDAPCSGEGMFRKDDKAIEDWSIGNVQLCSERQRRIVADVFPALKEGGLLLYSTCTYNQEEDEKNVQWIAEEMGATILSIETPQEWNITSNGLGYHFYPHKTKGEGFFLAVLQKNCSQTTIRIKSPKQLPLASKQAVDICQRWMTNSEMKIFQYGDSLFAIHKDWVDTALLLHQKLRVVHNGQCLGTQKGKDIIPDTSLALSWIINTDAFEKVDCSWEMAIQFLKKENIVLSDCPKGIVLFCFENRPLGWGKNVGNRCNNLYPADWHIRMEADHERYTKIVE